jgi:hypothetical protein
MPTGNSQWRSWILQSEPALVRLVIKSNAASQAQPAMTGLVTRRGKSEVPSIALFAPLGWLRRVVNRQRQSVLPEWGIAGNSPHVQSPSRKFL